MSASLPILLQTAQMMPMTLMGTGTSSGLQNMALVSNPITRTNAVDSPDINSGPSAGGVFTGKGNSFLDPNTILSTVNNFSQSINAPADGTDPFGSNPDSLRILNGTSSRMDEILSGNIQLPDTPIPILPGMFGVPVPDIFRPDLNANTLVLSTQAFLANLLPNSENMGGIGMGGNTGGTASPGAMSPTMTVTPSSSAGISTDGDLPASFLPTLMQSINMLQNLLG